MYLLQNGEFKMTVNVPQIDIVTKEVTEKLDYFENKVNGYARDVSEALGNLTEISVAEITPPSNLAKPNESGFEPLVGMTAPELNIERPVPPVIDLNIQKPKDMVSPEFSGLNIDIPDAPIFSEDLSTPDFIDASLIPEFDTAINLPTAPTFNVQNFDAGTLPDKINLSDLIKDLDLSDLELPATPEAPILNLPTAPSMDVISVPLRPEISDDVEMPDAPTIVIPEMDAMEKIQLPDFKYEEIPVFEGKPPEFNIAIPDNIDALISDASQVVKQDYYAFNTESAIKPLVLEIRSWLDGSHTGLGLPAAVEQSLFNRARERTSRETERSVQEAVTEWASRGFSMPQGMLAKQVSDIRDQGKLAIADLNRDILIQSFDKQLEHIRFLTEQGMALEKMKQDMWLAYVSNTMELVKFQIDSKISVLNAQISIFNAQNSAFESLITVYKTKIDATISRISAYKAMLDAQAVIGQLNQQKVDVFKAKIEAVMTNVEVYKALVQGATARAGLIATKFDAYKSEVQAYSEQIGAEKLKVEAYDSQIKAETSKASMYESLARMYAATVDGVSAKANVKSKQIELNLEAARVKISEYQANIEAYKAEIDAKMGVVQSNTSAFNSQVELFKAQADVETSRVNTQASVIDSISRTKISFADAQAKFAEMRMRVGIANSESLARFADMKSRTAIAVSEAHSRYADLSLRTTIANADVYNRYIESKSRVSISNAEMQARYADMNSRTNIAFAETQSRYNDMLLRTQIANAETKARYADMNVRTNIAFSEMQLKEYEAKMQNAIQKAQLALEAAKAVGQFSSQLAAGAMSAIHVQAGISATASISGGVTESNGTSTNHNYSYGG